MDDSTNIFPDFRANLFHILIAVEFQRFEMVKNNAPSPLIRRNPHLIRGDSTNIFDHFRANLFHILIFPDILDFSSQAFL